MLRDFESVFAFDALPEGRFRDWAPLERFSPFLCPFFKTPPLVVVIRGSRMKSYNPLREDHFQLQIVPGATTESNVFLQAAGRTSRNASASMSSKYMNLNQKASSTENVQAWPPPRKSRP